MLRVKIKKQIMPDPLPVLVTTGAGIAVLAGVVSGVCYLITNGFGRYRSALYRNLPLPACLKYCIVCERQFQEAGATAEPCTVCGHTFCRHSCGSFNEKSNTWSCKSCLTNRPVKFESGLDFLSSIQKTFNINGWLLNSDINLNRSRAASVAARDWTAARDATPVSNTVPRPLQDAHATRLQIRDFLENLAAQLTGGPLDDVSVSRLYDHHQYEAMFQRYHSHLRTAIALLAIALHTNMTHLPQAMVSVSGAESASSAHARLKRLIQRVIEEAMTLPAMLDYGGFRKESPAKLPDFDAKTYEDLLATAILNKVIDRYQQDYDRDRERSSGIHSESVSPSGSHDDDVDLNSNGLVKRALESGLGAERSTPSASSLEPLSRDGSIHSEGSDHYIRNVIGREPRKRDKTVYSSDEEYLDNAYKTPLEGALASINFGHKTRVPFPEYGVDIIDVEVPPGTRYDEIISEDLLDEDHHLNGEIQAANNTWEENWLFQKKRLKSAQSVPVPMLVPNSNTEYKAMIGDRDADDTTDLSDAGSDIEDDLDDDIKHVLVNSKSIIGGKNMGSLLDLVDDDDVNDDVIVPLPVKESTAVLVDIDSGPLNKAEFGVSEIHRGLANSEIETKIGEDDIKNEEHSSITNTNNDASDVNEATNLDVVDSATQFNDQPNSLHQKESEYSETFAVPVQRHMDSLRRITRDSNGTLPKPTPAPRSRESTLIELTSLDDSLHETDTPDLPPDSIAVREKQKWLNAVPMPNNPYSAEAIEKRLNQKGSSVFDILTNGIPLEKETAEPSKRANSPPRTMKDVLSHDMTEYKRYGRDYYIKEARKSTGSRKVSSEDNIHEAFNTRDTPPLIITDGLTNEENVIIELNRSIDEGDSNVFCAKPVIIENDETDSITDIIENDSQDSAYQKDISSSNDNREQNLNISDTLSDSISSVDDNLRIYNIQSGTILMENGLGKPAENDGEKIIEKSIVNTEMKVPTKVKDLAKIFTNGSSETRAPKATPRRKKISIDEPEIILINKNPTASKQPMHMHSLTGRSLSREFREELKLSMPKMQKIPGGVNEAPEGMDEPLKGEKAASPQPKPGTLKNKLAFFEKFNKH